MIRKSTNLLLTRSFSGCLSSLFRKPNIALLQVIQIIIDTGYLEEATVYLEEFVSNITGYVVHQWTPVLPTSCLTLCASSKVQIVYSRVSFCDSSFYDDSLSRPLSSRTEHSRIVHPCRNSASPFSTWCASSSFLECMCFFFFFISAVLLSWLWFFCPWRPSKRQKRRKYQNSWHYILSWCLPNHGLGLLQQNKKWFDWYFFQLSV